MAGVLSFVRIHEPHLERSAVSTIITECPAGHHIRSSADRDKQGYCRQCRSDSERMKRMRARAALDVVRAFEDCGVKFVNDGVPITAEAVAAQLVRVYGTA